MSKAKNPEVSAMNCPGCTVPVAEWSGKLGTSVTFECAACQRVYGVTDLTDMVGRQRAAEAKRKKPEGKPMGEMP